MRCAPLNVVEAFYRSFRAYVMGDDYNPSDWEIILDEDGFLDRSWEGAHLRTIRSDLIEGSLHERNAQLSLELQGGSGRRYKHGW